MTVFLTRDTDLIAQMQRKLKEYNERMAFIAPEMSPHCTYKRDILECLLEDGIADYRDLRFAAAQQSWFNERMFLNAFAVIRAYNYDQKEKLFGGTGLS